MVKRRKSKKTLDPKAVFETDIQLKTNSMKELDACLTTIVRAFNRVTSTDDVRKALQDQEDDWPLIRRYARQITPRDILEAFIVRRLQVGGLHIEMESERAHPPLRKLRTRVRRDRLRAKEWLLETFGRW